MSGTKRTYNLEEKNYFKFFGLPEKQGISVRSLTTHYKKIVSILKESDDFISRDKQLFAQRAFETLADPIARVRYILEQNGFENDVRDGASAEDFAFIHQLNNHYEISNTVEDIDLFILELKEQTAFIKDQIEQSIDLYANYKIATGLLNRFYEISTIHEKAKVKKKELEAGVTHVVFDR